MGDEEKIHGLAPQETASLLAAALESTADGLLVIDCSGKITTYNQKFLAMWHIPESLSAKRDDKILLEYARHQLKDPDGFLEKVTQLYAQPEADSFDVLEFRDGRIFERFSRPQRRGEKTIGRVWSFRDVTDRRQGEEKQRRDRETALRLAGEIAIIAESGRLIGSTLDIEEVYDRFAAEARKLIPFDRLSLNLNNRDRNTIVVAYTFGLNVPGRRPGDSFPLQGSVNEALERTRTGMLLHPTGIAELKGQYSHLVSTVQEGFCSLMSVPLISRDEVIGALHFRSKKPRLYREQDLRLAERIGTQIAGAIANAKFFSELKRTERSLRESEGRFRALVEQAAVGVAEIEMGTGRFFTVNRRFCEMVGRTEEELMAANFLAITHPEDLHLHEEKTALLAAGKIDHYTLEKRYLRPDGESVWVNLAVSPLWKPREKPGRNMIVVEDITERKRAEAEFRDSEEKYREILENIEDGYFEVDLAGNITFFNPSLCRILGYPGEELLGMNNRAYMDAENAKEVFRSFNQVYRSGIPVKNFEWETIRKDGARRHLEVSVSLIVKPGEKPTGFRGIARDVTERKQMEAALRESEKRYRDLSMVDELTQLYNSRHFYFQLKIELDRSNRYGQPLTLLLLDIDNFKHFNDAYGHVEGDQVLRRLGQVIKRCLRETDFAFRYGGEEFTILLPMTISADGAVTAERIRTEFKKETFSPAPGLEVHKTVSTGLAQYRPPEEMKAFVHRVDQLMYQGKKNGKDRVCCEPSVQAQPEG